MRATVPSRRFLLALSIATSAAGARPAQAQARVFSEPPQPSLLNITEDWARASSLGDLRELATGSDHVELRVWAGYGSTGTQAVVLRRAGGHWSAFLARVMRCAIQVPKAVGDTASSATIQRYMADARHNCATELGDVGAGTRIITADTLVVGALEVPDSLGESVWRAALQAEVVELPPRVDRGAEPTGDFTYVIEVRRGRDYRASSIEHVETARMEVDQRVEHIYAAVNRLVPLALQLNP